MKSYIPRLFAYIVVFVCLLWRIVSDVILTITTRISYASEYISSLKVLFFTYFLLLLNRPNSGGWTVSRSLLCAYTLRRETPLVHSSSLKVSFPRSLSKCLNDWPVALICRNIPLHRFLFCILSCPRRIQYRQALFTLGYYVVPNICSSLTTLRSVISQG